MIETSAWARLFPDRFSWGRPRVLGGGSYEVGQTPAVSFSLPTPIQMDTLSRADKSHRSSEDEVVGRPEAIVRVGFRFEELVLGCPGKLFEEQQCVLLSLVFSAMLFCTRGSCELQSDLRIFFYLSAVSTMNAVLFFL